MYCHRFSLPCFFLYCIQFCIHNLRLTTAKIETKENHSVSVVLSCQQRNMVLAGVLGDLELNPVDSTGYMATQLKGWRGRGVGTLKKFAGLPYQDLSSKVTSNGNAVGKMIFKHGPLWCPIYRQSHVWPTMARCAWDASIAICWTWFPRATWNLPAPMENFPLNFQRQEVNCKF